MIFSKEFRKCAIMSKECPNCGQIANASFSRLVKDSCGHTKCRMCLVYEEDGCKICQTEHYAQEKLCPSNRDSNNTHKLFNEEIVLPLELVINKDKSKENHSDSTSTECRSSELDYENVTFDKDGVHKVVHKNDTITDNDSNKLYIPKMETRDIILDIRSQLKNENDHNNSHNQVEKKLEETIEKKKEIKCRDRSHIIIVPGIPEKYKCNICSKIFRNKKGKCYHDACVTGIKPYQCTFCDKSFVKRSHFVYHERIHKGDKPYKCNLCEKAFPQQSKLNRHMFSHKEKQFICPKCKKQYSKQDDLKNHLNVHNGTRYNCKSCNKSFGILFNLKRHLLTHTNERPHICNECNKSFKDRFLLKRHKGTHEKERPFSCAHCNKFFLSKSGLRRHLNVHSDEKPFFCEYCQTPFRRKDNLNRHIRHHHTENFGCEARETSIVEANSQSSKSNQQTEQKQTKQKQPKKTQPKSPGKITAIYPKSHVDQINSRLDSMGNITPVIRTTSEVSNAVPVINGPIRRFEDRTDKKTFTYTEPIPIAEAVVINCRIEEKLYPQSASSHNYFVRSCLKDRNSRVNSYPNNKLTPQENYTSTAVISSRIESSLLPSTIERKNLAINAYEEKITRYDEDGKGNRGENEMRGDEKTREEEENYNTYRENDIVSLPESNCVSTIKKHTTQQLTEEHLNENSTANNDNSEATILPKNFSKQLQKETKRCALETQNCENAEAVLIDASSAEFRKIDE